MKKSVLSILLILSIMLSLVACSSTTKDTPSDSNGEKTPPESQEKEPQQGADSQEEKDYSEHYTISYAAVAMVEGVDYNEDELSKEFQNKFNIDWEPVALTWDNWAEKTRIWINASDMPDFVMWDFNYGDYINYADQGLLREMPDGWKEKWPNMGKVYEHTGVGPALEEKLGNAYMIPRVIYFNKPTEPLVSHTNLWIRKDWAEEVEFEVKDKYSPSELIEFARLLKEKDPVGNGKTIPIDMNASTLNTVFVSPFNVNFDKFYKGEDGKYHWGAADPETLEGLKAYHQAYTEGLINKDFFALKNNEEISNYESGISGIIYQQGFGRSLKLTNDRYQENTGNDPKADLHMAYAIGDDGKYHAIENTNFWTASIFSPNMEDAKFERLMDVLDWSATEEGQNLIRMGFEGKDWERDADGNITITREKVEGGNFINLDKIYPSLNPLYNNLSILPDDFGLRDPGLDKDILETVDARFAGKQKDGCDAGTVLPIDWDMYFYTSPAYEKTKYNYGEEFAKLIVMDGDIEANWKAWVEEKAPQIDRVLEEINSELAN